MTDTEITALARELAEELYNDDKSYNTILWWCEEPKERKAEELEYTLRFLFRRYCLVEKEKLKAIRFRKVYSAEDVRSKFTEEYLIDALFPEIVKEVEG